MSQCLKVIIWYFKNSPSSFQVLHLTHRTPPVCSKVSLDTQLPLFSPASTPKSLIAQTPLLSSPINSIKPTGGHTSNGLLRSWTLALTALDAQSIFLCHFHAILGKGQTTSPNTDSILSTVLSTLQGDSNPPIRQCPQDPDTQTA